MTDAAVYNAESNTNTFVDYKKLKYVKAKIKFYNADDGFGFVTVIDEDGQAQFDAFLPGEKLIRAGYKSVTPGQVISIKHVMKLKGQAVVMVKHPPDYISESPNNDPVVVKPLKRMEDRYNRYENTDTHSTNEDDGDVATQSDWHQAAEKPAFPDHNTGSNIGDTPDVEESKVASPTTLP